MTTYEQKRRLAFASLGIAMTIAALVFLFIESQRFTARSTILILGTLFALPMLWTAPVLILAHDGDGVNYPGWRRWAINAATAELVGTGSVLVVGTIAFVGRQTFNTDCTPFAAIETICLGLPTGLVCVSYLVVLLWRRLFREPDPEQRGINLCRKRPDPAAHWSAGSEI